MVSASASAAANMPEQLQADHKGTLREAAERLGDVENMSMLSARVLLKRLDAVMPSLARMEASRHKKDFKQWGPGGLTQGPAQAH